MMGTYASVLAMKNIKTYADRFGAEVESDINNINGVLKLTRIRVSYFLKIRPTEEDDARWALENYISLCPGAQSVIDCIKIDQSLTLDSSL